MPIHLFKLYINIVFQEHICFTLLKSMNGRYIMNQTEVNLHYHLNGLLMIRYRCRYDTWDFLNVVLTSDFFT